MKFTVHPLVADDRRLPVGARIDAQLADRLRVSFEQALGHKRQLGEVFYARLFARCPHLRPMFPADMAGQEKKLTETLRWVIEHLRDPAAVGQRLAELGRRHVGYGARPEHYPLVRDMLVAAMADTAGDAWDPTLTADWTTALDLIGSRMLAGASE